MNFKIVHESTLREDNHRRFEVLKANNATVGTDLTEQFREIEI